MAYEQISWATDDIDSSGNPTKIIPPVEIMRTGLEVNEPMGRQWFNYILNHLLKSNDPGNGPATHQVKIYTSPQSDLVASGFWRLIKTEVLTTPVSVTMYYYEHIGS